MDLTVADRGRLWKNRPRRFLQRIWQSKTAYAFLFPMFALLLTFEYWPFVLAFYRSFFMWDGVALEVFTGLGNYVEIVHDPIFWKSVSVVLRMLAFDLTLPLLGPLVSAELVYNLRSSRMRYFWRIVMIVPSIVPGMVSLLLWRYIYNPQDGFLNIVLRSVHLQPQTWLADPQLALPCVLFVGFPWAGGTWMLIYLAGLLNIPSEVIDASIVDGCGLLRRIVSVDLPLIVGQIKLRVILTCIGALQQFVSVLVLTDGGPFFATMVPGLYLFRQAFDRSRLGYASAVGVLLFVAVFSLSFVSNRYLKSSVEYGE